ncbi:TonB-dependent receptor [Flagellimonas meridianipacifica]|uniref:Iron complex outermembrane receptor protein n=1 Tax=Flagellimonas meridianipacifica TaxID=1080225 RepID=A0A2T0MG82_9FLAO|nr:TonB-dependent receptor [Allomuricauda pacifica]PRX56583.1 iron complex outermembrane receptor protein [Allomuricauda pacifica]
MKLLCSTYYQKATKHRSGSMRQLKRVKKHRIKTIFTITALFGLALSLSAQESPTDSLEGKQVNLNEVVVSASRVTQESPVTFSNLQKTEIAKVNLGQDIPVLLNYLPSVVSTTFDGTGVGYTDFRIRGADNSRINVTINGIPYNDADSQTTFFVNLQDFVSSVENIQIQRGVGTSTNGAGAFGASINILTDNVAEEGYGQISNSFGSFNTRKHTVKFGTGLLNDHFAFSGRLSRIKSDGYVDRAFSDLSSYFLDGVYKDDNTQIKLLVFGGEEITGLSFAGLDAAGLETNRRFNFDGLYVDRDGVQRFYDRQTDNYKQDHYQLHLTQQFDDNWSGNISFHYTYGRGFFEQYVDDASLSFFRLDEFDSDGETVTNSDLITRQHLNSDFYGTVFSLIYNSPKVDAVFGGGWNRYDGEQFGEVIGSEFAIVPNIPNRFFENESDKKDFNVYAKGTFKLNDQLSLFGDLQVRNINYEAGGSLFEPGAALSVDETYTFFNPKAGVTYNLNQNNKLYLSYARANREPARVDFENGNPEAESLNDFELGWRHITSDFQLNTNVYYLDFRNQLVLTGALDEVGFPIRTNSGSSFRLGLEIDANWNISDKFSVRPNLALSTNKNRDFFFQRDGELQNLGNTNISFSPEVIAGNVFTFSPNEGWSFSLFSKYVGEQFMGNIDSPVSRLEAYFVNDLNIQYQITTIPIVKSIVFSGQINNLFDLEYENNGFFFTFDDDFTTPGTVTTIEGNGFYPQAGINFLLGATINL